MRYTDYRDKADQWRLFRANGDIEFTTTDDFSDDFLPDAQALSNVSVDSRERISVPCKMTLTFNGLVFQQIDDTDTIGYGEKTFVDDLFTDGMERREAPVMLRAVSKLPAVSRKNGLKTTFSLDLTYADCLRGVSYSRNFLRIFWLHWL